LTNPFQLLFNRVLAGFNFFEDLLHVRQTFNLLGVCTARDTNIVARPAFVHSLVISNPGTAATVWLVDGGSASGAAAGEMRFFAPAGSCITHQVNRRMYSTVRIQSDAAFPAGMEVSATGN
jgi:hypothetical protein